jgi:hypothetical protein
MAQVNEMFYYDTKEQADKAAADYETCWPRGGYGTSTYVYETRDPKTQRSYWTLSVSRDSSCD